MTPGGEVVGFEHLIDEEAPGARLGDTAARAVAESFIARVRKAGTGDLRFLSSTAKEQKNRTDHRFVWEL